MDAVLGERGGSLINVVTQGQWGLDSVLIAYSL